MLQVQLMLRHNNLMRVYVIVFVFALFLGPLQAREAAAQRLQHLLRKVAATLSSLILRELFVCQLLCLQFLDTDQVLVAAESVRTETIMRRKRSLREQV